MKHLKILCVSAAAIVGSLAMTGAAQAATFPCGVATKTCKFDGTTGGISNVKLDANTSSTDSFGLSFDKAGVFTFSLTTGKLDFVKAVFNGQTIIPVKGTDYSFTVPGKGSLDLVVSASNPTSHSATYGGTFDFAAVPEPASWGMLIVGAGMAGGALRRRRAPRAAIA